MQHDGALCLMMTLVLNEYASCAQVWASHDSGVEWELVYQLNETVGINPREAAAYSSMVQVNKTHFALVYERDNAAHLSLVYIPLSVALVKH